MPAPTLVLRGSVTDQSGRPVAGARVALTAGPSPVPDIAALTGDDGHFAFGVPAAGTYRVEAFGDPGHAATSIEVAAGQAGSALLVLHP